MSVNPSSVILLGVESQVRVANLMQATLMSKSCFGRPSKVKAF